MEAFYSSKVSFAGSIVVCEGGTAELVCPRGMVISIALANYGRYSARVCYENDDLDDVVPMTQCHNPRTMPTLRKRSVYPAVLF
ncbi:hypothetical protein ANCCAN_07086 [Ancylostoma caninum]|uniref:SUEL-type lectin domain-containing protein n=1 Tax=Ancylostoma caninum TaxID=29170 RepID=A0A368GVB6_ANCCA|nr:hypothetical protein ANCCAN_07086 [Ancylostoma caninum]